MHAHTQGVLAIIILIRQNPTLSTQAKQQHLHKKVRQDCSCLQDLDLPPEMVAEAKAAPGQDTQFVAPTPGVTPNQRWLQRCALAPDHVAAGDFSAAMRLLNRCGPAQAVL